MPYVTVADSAAISAFKQVKTLIIVGCGLLGSSVALAFRATNPTARIVGVDTNELVRTEASALPVYDSVSASISQLDLAGTSGSMIGVVATPPTYIAQNVRELAPLCALVVDVGSVKAPVIDALVAAGGAPDNFVPCHPMAGSHRQGPASGSAELFDGRWVFVVGTKQSADLKPAPEFSALDLPTPTLSAMAHVFWQSLGARTQDIDALEHDRAVAYTSHLPHLLASAYMAVDSPDVAAAGTGFMEFTRLAKANPEMWSQVLQSNQVVWRPLLASYISNLQNLDALIENGDTQEIMAYLSARREERFAFDIPADEAHSLV